MPPSSPTLTITTTASSRSRRQLLDAELPSRSEHRILASGLSRARAGSVSVSLVLSRLRLQLRLQLRLRLALPHALLETYNLLPERHASPNPGSPSTGSSISTPYGDEGLFA